MTLSSPTRLIVLRGNSASGKSSVAAGLRERYDRGVALVSQDTLRRDVLRERDVPGGANIGLIELTVRHALDHGFHTASSSLTATIDQVMRAFCDHGSSHGG